MEQKKENIYTNTLDEKNIYANTLDALQKVAISTDIKDKSKSESKQIFNFNKLSLLFRLDYKVGDIVISQPSVFDIATIGEDIFYKSLAPFLYNSTSIRVFLWDIGIDWCNVKDIEVFDILSKSPGFNSKILKLLFRDTDFADFQLSKFNTVDESNNLYDELCLYNSKTNTIIKENEFMEIAEYIRTMFHIHPKVEKTKSKIAKKWMIDEEKTNMSNNTEDKKKPTLFSLISGCINHPGFKYNLQDLRDVGIYQFMDAIERLQIYNSSNALLNGSYSGFCDMSKIPDEKFNFFRNSSSDN